jgi:hypothetical protein
MMGVVGSPSNENCTELFGIQEAESAGTVSQHTLRLSKFARVLVRYYHVARRIINPNHGIM